MADGGEQDSGYGPVMEWRITTRATPAERRRNVEAALSLGLPELLPSLAGVGRVASVMATGVSFEDSPVGLPDTFACNGALGLMLARGEAPTYWVAMDPQGPPVRAFLEGDLPTETTYLVASTCHPSVFERLRDRDVRVWHASDDDETQGYGDLLVGREASTAIRLSSVTLCALELARFAFAYDKTETWGWEGCFRGRRHHATDQYDNREVVTIDIDGETIPTSRVWLYEMNGALGLLKHFPRPLTVHGDGLFARAIAAGRASGQQQPEPVQ